MRFKSKQIKQKIGDTRTITKFLFFPTKINGETRWMEKATIEQTAELWVPQSITDKYGRQIGGYQPIPSRADLDRVRFIWKNTKWLEENPDDSADYDL